MGKASQTGGVKPMSIAGRLITDRERLVGMTDAERVFRKQWLKDQELAPSEPRIVPEIYKATFNPIRRFYRFPLDQVEKALSTVIGPTRAQVLRAFSAKIGMGVALTYWMWYNIKYNGNSWERKGGIKILTTRPEIVPGDERYPCDSDRCKGEDYSSRGFKEVTLNL